MKLRQSAMLLTFGLIANDASALYVCTSSNGAVAYQSSPCNAHFRQKYISKKQLGKTEVYGGIRFEKGFALQNFSVDREPTVTNGEQWINYTVTAINNTAHDREVYLTYQGLDGQGKVLKEVYVVGVIHAHSSKEFRDHASVAVEALNAIEKWVLAR